MAKLRGNQIELSELFNEGATVTGILDFVAAGSPATSTPQLVLPNYSTVNLPVTNLEGGVVYDITTKALTFYNGSSWSAISPGNNWINANNGDDFTIAPSSTTNAIAIGHNASANSGKSISVGYDATAGLQGIVLGAGASSASSNNSIAIGLGAVTNQYGDRAVVIGYGASGSSNGAIAIGLSATVVTKRNNGVAIGRNSRAGHTSDVALGAYATTANASSGGNCVVIGRSAGSTNNYSSTVIGAGSKAELDYQVVIGYNLAGTDVTTTDTTYSVKIGSAEAGNENILHMHSKGKLELVGDEAQFIIPKYATGFEPLNPVEGSLIYDLSTNVLKAYDAASWTAVNTNWIHANDGNIFGNPPSALGVRGIAIGDNASIGVNPADSIAIGTGAYVNNAIAGRPNAIAIGTNAFASQHSVAVGKSTRAGGNGSVAIGYGSSGGGTQGIAIGQTSNASGYHQLAIGNGVADTSVDVPGIDYSVKIGDGATGANKNLLHLFSKGKLEIYGAEAQFVLPTYATGSIPATTVEGGLVYDSTTKALTFYNGTAWNEVSGAADLTISTQAGADYTLVIGDKDALVTMDHPTANTLTIPTNASVAFPIGAQVLVEQEAAGTTTISGGTGSPPAVTIHSAGNFFDLVSQYTTVTLIKKATDTWLLTGDLA